LRTNETLRLVELRDYDSYAEVYGPQGKPTPVSTFIHARNVAHAQEVKEALLRLVFDSIPKQNKLYPILSRFQGFADKIFHNFEHFLDEADKAMFKSQLHKDWFDNRKLSIKPEHTLIYALMCCLPMYGYKKSREKEEPIIAAERYFSTMGRPKNANLLLIKGKFFDANFYRIDIREGYSLGSKTQTQDVTSLLVIEYSDVSESNHFDILFCFETYYRYLLTSFASCLFDNFFSFQI
jgi:hypothetical protein